MRRAYSKVDRQTLMACYGNRLVPQDEIGSLSATGFVTQNGSNHSGGVIYDSLRNATAVSLALFHRKEQNLLLFCRFCLPIALEMCTRWSCWYRYCRNRICLHCGQPMILHKDWFDSGDMFLILMPCSGRQEPMGKKVIKRIMVVVARTLIENSVSPNHRLEDDRYELHVRGFTKHASSRLTSGNLWRIKRKIPYLVEPVYLRRINADFLNLMNGRRSHL